MSLDDKLRDVLRELQADAKSMPYFDDDEINEAVDWSMNSQDEAIAQIKQAFADELKREVNYYPFGTPETTEPLQDLINKEHGYMTGQEWYDKFMSEWDKSGVFLKPDETGDLTEAAKKAAGLE